MITVYENETILTTLKGKNGNAVIVQSVNGKCYWIGEGQCNSGGMCSTFKGALASARRKGYTQSLSDKHRNEVMKSVVTKKNKSDKVWGY